MLKLLAGMRDPADAAGHRKQRELAARGHPQRMHQHRQRVVDIDELAGGCRDTRAVQLLADKRAKGPAPKRTTTRRTTTTRKAPAKK